MKSILYRKSFSSFCAVFFLLILAACNDEIFIDGDDVPEDRAVTLDGDGGEAVVSMPSKGLRWWGISTVGSDRYNCLCYDKNGEMIDMDSPASEIFRIVYRTAMECYELEREGDNLRIRSVSNANSDTIRSYVNFEYDYIVRTLSLTIMPGKPLVLERISYSDLQITENFENKIFHESFNNGSSLPQTFAVRPYAETPATLKVMPDLGFQEWVMNKRFPMVLPSYENGGWTIRKGDEVLIGSTITYPCAEQSMQVDIPLAANSRADVTTKVIYSKAELIGMMDFHNTILDLHDYVWFTATSTYPVNYEISVNEKN